MTSWHGPRFRPRESRPAFNPYRAALTFLESLLYTVCGVVVLGGSASLIVQGRGWLLFILVVSIVLAVALVRWLARKAKETS